MGVCVMMGALEQSSRHFTRTGPSCLRHSMQHSSFSTYCVVAGHPYEGLLASPQASRMRACRLSWRVLCFFPGLV